MTFGRIEKNGPMSGGPLKGWINSISLLNECVTPKSVWGAIKNHFGVCMTYWCSPFQVGKGYSDEAALILHRKVFDCQLSSRAMGLPCSTTQGKMSIPKLFNNFAVESFIPSSLSLMHSPPDAQNTSEVSLSPMEISTSRIRLRWTWPSGWVEKLWFGYLPWFLTCNN